MTKPSFQPALASQPWFRVEDEGGSASWCSGRSLPGSSSGFCSSLVVFAGGEESADHRQCAARARGWIHAARACVEPLHRSAAAMGACTRHRGGSSSGSALLLFAPGNGALGLAGWVWPVLLVLLVGWSFWGARRSLHNWSRRALLYPALFVLSARRARRCRTRRFGGDLQQPRTRRSNLFRQRAASPSELHRFGRADSRAVQRTRRAHAELGLGSTVAFVEDACVCVRSRRTRVERWQRQVARTATN